MKNKRIYRGMFLSLALIAGCEGVKDSPSSADGIKDSLSSMLTEGTAIQLGETITIDGEGATASDQTVRITQAGTYLISGTLEDGQIQVEVGNQEEVNLVLNETQISSTTGAPILITQSAKTTITLMEGTQNVISHQMVMNDGVIRLVATDDGINAAGGMDGSGFMSFFNPTTTAQQESESGWIELNGGWLYVNASGDGLDANGSIIMTGGVVIVEGPTSGHDGILDFDETFDLQGGQLIASGGVGMLQTPSETSTQPTLVIQDSFESGELIHIQSEEGAEIVTFSPSKASQVLIISSPDLKMESTYRVLSGGTYSVEATDGVYQDGTYTEGEERFQVVLSDLITSNGTLTGDGMRGPGMKEGPGMRGTKDMREAPEMKDHPKMEMNSDLKTPTLNSF